MAEAVFKIEDSLKDSVSSKRENLTASLILGNAGSSLTSSRTASTTSSSNSSRVGTPPSVASHYVVEPERCSCCTMDDFWKMYDSFKLMDKRGCGSVRRCDFYEASTEHLTLEMQRTIQKADLHRRFRSNAAELTLQELLGRLWPNATESDQKKMTDWTKLREASTILLDPSFQGTRQDLKRIFDLLDADGSQTLSMGELVRARIITKGESQNLLEKWYSAFSEIDARQEARSKFGKQQSVGLNFNEFCRMTQKHLCEKYVQKDTTWEDQCRSAYKVSRSATMSMIASREGRELPMENQASPQKRGLKAAGLAVVAPTMFTRSNTVPCGKIHENATMVMAC